MTDEFSPAEAQERIEDSVDEYVIAVDESTAAREEAVEELTD
jgi:hypothetical protein